MVTKELIKAEVDRVQEEYLEALYKIIQALTTTTDTVNETKITPSIEEKVEDLDWLDFIQETYGCLVDVPIERGDQGNYEIREAIE